VAAEFGELHPRVLKTLDAQGPLYAFELNLDALPEPKRKAVKTRPPLELSPLMPLTRDFAFVVQAETPAGELVRPILGADKQLIAEARVFDVYQGPGVPEGAKSVAVEVTVQPRDKTLTDAEIEALSAKIVAAAEKAVGARLRS
jgi:phenylalanyl-tRNA synthetase beta chain